MKGRTCNLRDYVLIGLGWELGVIYDRHMGWNQIPPEACIHTCKHMCALPS